MSATTDQEDGDEVPVLPALLYHYTTVQAARSIVRDGRIRAAEQTLHRDMFARDAGRLVGPHVWFTENPLGEATTGAKQRAAGYRGDFVGHMARVAVRFDGVESYSLEEYAARTATSWEDWMWVVRTTEMAGGDWEIWRLAAADVPSAAFAAVEVMTGIDAVGTSWGPLA